MLYCIALYCIIRSALKELKSKQFPNQRILLLAFPCQLRFACRQSLCCPMLLLKVPIFCRILQIRPISFISIQYNLNIYAKLDKCNWQFYNSLWLLASAYSQYQRFRNVDVHIHLCRFIDLEQSCGLLFRNAEIFWFVGLPTNFGKIVAYLDTSIVKILKLVKLKRVQKFKPIDCIKWCIIFNALFIFKSRNLHLHLSYCWKKTSIQLVL